MTGISIILYLEEFVGIMITCHLHAKVVCSCGGYILNAGFEMSHEQHGFWHISECNMEI